MPPSAERPGLAAVALPAANPGLSCGFAVQVRIVLATPEALDGRAE